MHASSIRLALLFLMGGCATSPAKPPVDRYSPAEMKNGPSLYETGRFAVVQPSSGGLQIDAGAVDRPSLRPSPRPATARATAKRKARARAQRTR